MLYNPYFENYNMLMQTKANKDQDIKVKNAYNMVHISQWA